MSENRHPNKKRRATSPDEQVKRIRLPRSSVAASAGSIAATSANASHGSTNRVGSNKRAREEQSTVPSSIIKKARANPATLPLALPFTLAPPVPKPTKKKNLSADEVKIFGHLPLRKQLLEAAAALIALAQQAQNINKPPAVFIDLPGGKRRRILSQAISSSNNNGIGRPLPNRRRRDIVAGPIPIWNLKKAPAPTTAPAPAPTEATAATSTATATAGNQAAKAPTIPINTDQKPSDSSDDKEVDEPYGLKFIQDTSRAPAKPKKRERSNDSSNEFLPTTTKKIRVPSTSIPLSNTRKQNKGLSVRFSDKCRAQPFKKDSTPENVSNDFREHVILMKTILRGVVEEEQAPEEEAGDEPAMDVNESAAKIQALVRGVYARKMLIQAIRAATMIQSTYRGVSARSSATKANESATKIQALFRGYSTRSMKPRAKPQFEVAAAAMDVDVDEDSQESVDFDAAGYNTEDDDTTGSNPQFEFDPAAMDTPEMDVDNDGQDSVNLDAASNVGESNNTEAVEEEEEDAMDEEEEVEAVQPAPRRRPRMLAELQSTLDGWYWRQATTRRSIDRN